MNAALLAAVIGHLSTPTGDPVERRSVERALELLVADTPGATLKIRRIDRPWIGAAAEAVNLVTADGATVLVTPPSGEGPHLVVQVATKLRVPVVLPALAPSLTRAGIRDVLRALPDARAQAAALVGHLCGDARPCPLAALVPDTRDGRVLLDAFTHAGGTVTRFTDPARPPSGARALLLLGPAEAMGHALAAARRAGVELPAAGPSRIAAPRFLRAAGAAAEGVICVRSRDETPAARAFVERYRARFGEAPDDLGAATYAGARRALSGQAAPTVAVHLARARGGRFVELKPARPTGRRRTRRSR